MAQQYFLSVEDCFDVLMQELPDGPYSKDRADDPDPEKRSWSSSELRTQASLFADLYLNLSNIYADKFASTVTPSGLVRWEADFFAEAQDVSQSFAVRQQNLINKIRAIGGISMPAIADLIDTILSPLGLTFEIIAYCGMSSSGAKGAWILDDSQLGAETYLSGLDPIVGATTDPLLTPLDCDLDFAAAGLTALELEAIQRTAYTYEVRIFGNASPEVLARLDQQLTQREPARSTHVITNNATVLVPPDTIDLGLFNSPALGIFDAGTFILPPATYDVYDLGGFL